MTRNQKLEQERTAFKAEISKQQEQADDDKRIFNERLTLKEESIQKLESLVQVLKVSMC